MSELIVDDRNWARRYAAWQRAWPVPSFDADAFRRDDYGNLINWSAYGDRLSPWGWEIDASAADALCAVRALHWRTTHRLATQPRRLS